MSGSLGTGASQAGNASISVSASRLGSTLQKMMIQEDIQPGDDASYELCKVIYLYHPLGAKMIEQPIKFAQSQKREISIPKSPEEAVRDAFNAEWNALKVDDQIFNTAVVSRVYGVGSVVMVAKGLDPSAAMPTEKLADLAISFNVLDPLNTSGSLVMNQDPNAVDFQKHTDIRVAGVTYHRSRAVVLMNGRPIYIAYTNSSFGYVGRSSYQRALFPLKSFIQSMVTDDMVARKAGVLIVKLKQIGSVVDGFMKKLAGTKRQLVKEAETDNVISISTDEDIESLNLQNIDGAHGAARKNILENIASADDMPAVMLNNETFAEGFGEGSEDAKRVAHYVDGIRTWLQPLYDFFDPIVMQRAWNPAFYETIQEQFPEEYGSMDYKTAFYQWKNSFVATWPSLLTEPDSEKIKVEETKHKTIVAVLEVLVPILDPENKATVVQWAQDNLNENKMLFTTPLELDIEALKNYEPPPPPGGAGGAPGEQEPKPPVPFESEA